MGKNEVKIIKEEPTNDNLDLKDFQGVTKQYTDDGGLVYILTSDKRPEKCSVCGNEVFHKHTTYTRKVRDQDISGKTVGIIIKAHKYRCTKCKHIQIPEFPSIHSSTKMTQRFWEKIAFECLNYRLAEIIDRYRISSGMIHRVFNEYLEELEANNVLTTPEVLGIDEVHLHSRYSGVFVDIQNGRIIEMTENRKKDDIIEILEKMRDKSNLRCVTMDMWKPYKDAIKQVFGNDTPVVIDHFHVTKEVGKAFETIRRHITKEIKTKKKRASLKNARFLLLANSDELSVEKANQAKQLLNDFPEFRGPYALKEAFRDIYDAESREEAEIIYAEWKQAVREEAILYEQEELEKNPERYKKPNGTIIRPHYPFYDAVETIENWYEEIFAYFDHRFTNAGTEALNRVIRDIDREGRGYSFKILRAKCIYSQRLKDRPSNSSFKF